MHTRRHRGRRKGTKRRGAGLFSAAPTVARQPGTPSARPGSVLGQLEAEKAAQAEKERRETLAANDREVVETLPSQIEAQREEVRQLGNVWDINRYTRNKTTNGHATVPLFMYRRSKDEYFAAKKRLDEMEAKLRTSQVRLAEYEAGGETVMGSSRRKRHGSKKALRTRRRQRA